MLLYIKLLVFALIATQGVYGNIEAFFYFAVVWKYLNEIIDVFI